MNAEKLREKARELMRKAEEVENAKAVKIGKLILKHHKTDFKGVTIQQIMEEISAVVAPQKSGQEKHDHAKGID